MIYYTITSAQFITKNMIQVKQLDKLISFMGKPPLQKQLYVHSELLKIEFGSSNT